MLGLIPGTGVLDEGRHRAEFYRLWAAGFASGMTHPQSLTLMGPRESRRTESARAWLLSGSERGEDVASLVASGGDRFDDLERAILTLGDESGRLDVALAALASFQHGRHRLMLRLRKRMAYPLFTALAACFVIPFPLLFFGDARAYLTAALGAAALLFLSADRLVAALVARYGRKPVLVRARLARALASAVEAGLPLPRAVRLAADASGDGRVRGFVGRVTDARLATAPLSETLAGCPHLTPEFMATLATAEETGDFSALTRLAELYEDGFR
jgi:type II secretory pathway component PulF